MYNSGDLPYSVILLDLLNLMMNEKPRAKKGFGCFGLSLKAARIYYYYSLNGVFKRYY